MNDACTLCHGFKTHQSETILGSYDTHISFRWGFQCCNKEQIELNTFMFRVNLKYTLTHPVSDDVSGVKFLPVDPNFLLNCSYKLFQMINTFSFFVLIVTFCYKTHKMKMFKV